ncbi:MAG: hypothetical protein ACE5G9_06960 [Nitrospinales bacterium]
MTIPAWSNEDFETARRYLAGHEEQARVSAVLETDSGVTVILPAGLPGLGVTFHGVFMAAPILLFLVLLGAFLVIGVEENWGFNTITLTLAALCVLLLWGLGKVLKLLLKNRELFPRRHFVTLGSRGIAMHFSRWQLPGGSPRAAIAWEEVMQVRRGGKRFFPPALLCGITAAETLEVESAAGEKVVIPFHLRDNEPTGFADAVEEAVKAGMAGRKRNDVVRSADGEVPLAQNSWRKTEEEQSGD